MAQGVQIKKFKKKCLKEDVAVNCKTKKQAEQFLKWATSKGLKWSNGRSYFNNTSWNRFGKRTCYFLCVGMYDDTLQAKRHNHTILSFKEALK